MINRDNDGSSREDTEGLDRKRERKMKQYFAVDF